MEAALGVEVVAGPDPAAEANDHYAGNRAPLQPSAFVELAVGAVRPHGWLRQLLLQADGFHGHLGEISKFLAKDGNAWLDQKGGDRNGWEEMPYWLNGFGDGAYLLDRADQIKEARVWLEGAIRSQREDGFFGPGPGTKSTVKSTGGMFGGDENCRRGHGDPRQAVETHTLFPMGAARLRISSFPVIRSADFAK